MVAKSGTVRLRLEDLEEHLTMSEPVRQRLGRPIKAALPGTRCVLGLQVSEACKRRVEAAAKASGRTVSREAEWRITRSFWLEDLLAGRESKL